MRLELERIKDLLIFVISNSNLLMNAESPLWSQGPLLRLKIISGLLSTSELSTLKNCLLDLFGAYKSLILRQNLNKHRYYFWDWVLYWKIFKVFEAKLLLLKVVLLNSRHQYLCEDIHWSDTHNIDTPPVCQHFDDLLTIAWISLSLQRAKWQILVLVWKTPSLIKFQSCIRS